VNRNEMSVPGSTLLLYLFFGSYSGLGQKAKFSELLG